MSPEKLTAQIIQILDEKKAHNIVEIDLTDKSSLAASLVIATGTSQRHLNSLTDYLARGLSQHKQKPIAVEGADGSNWIVLDFGDVIVHLFTEEARAHYNLEKIWNFPLPHRKEKIDSSS